MFTVDGTGWILIKVVRGGYPRHLLGHKPVIDIAPSILAVRFNTHYEVNFERFQGQTLDFIESSLSKERGVPLNCMATCPYNTFRPSVENGWVEQNRVKNLGFDLD